jgi:hypothetical protein
MTTAHVNATLAQRHAINTIPGARITGAIYPGGTVWTFSDDDFCLVFYSNAIRVSERDWYATTPDALRAIRRYNASTLTGDDS